MPNWLSVKWVWIDPQWWSRLRISEPQCNPITMVQVWTLVVLSLIGSCVPTILFSSVWFSSVQYRFQNDAYISIVGCFGQITIACVLEMNSIREKKHNTKHWETERERENCSKVIICCWVNFGLKKWSQTKQKGMWGKFWWFAGTTFLNSEILRVGVLKFCYS